MARAASTRGAAKKSRPVARLADQRLDHLLDEQGPGVDLVEIAVAVIIAVVRIEVVAAAQVVGDLPVGIAAAVGALPPLSAVELLRLARRHAAVVLLGEPRGATAGAVAIVIAMSVPMAGFCHGRSGEAERRGAGDEECVSHDPTLWLLLMNVR